MSISCLWPCEQPRPTESRAEQRIYDALKIQLPKGWSAWHSLSIRTDQGHEGEGDFVLAIPNHGFLILEVKGGLLEQKDGRWFQNGIPLNKAPREQALGYAQKLNQRLVELGFKSVPYGVLTVFPETSFSFSPSQDNLSKLLLGAQDVPWIIDSIKAKLDKVFPENFYIPQTNWTGGLHQLWGETWVPKLKLGHKAQIDADERLKLDEEQLLVIDGLMGNRTLAVEGVAGSGKTLVAREAALKMAAAGKQVIYLCYTDALAEWLRPHLSPAGVKVFTVPRYAVNLLESTGQLGSLMKEPDFWMNVSLQAAVDALPSGETAPEVIILDEAQDLTENDWVLVESLGCEKTCWIFYDPAQAFWKDRAIPKWVKAGGCFRLTRCYRCPDSVIEFSKKMHGKPFDDLIVEEGIKEGRIALVDTHNESTVLARIDKEIRKLRSEGFALGDIAVLSLRGQSAEGGIAKLDRIGSFSIVRADDRAMTENIVGDTFLRFKGLERPAVIVTDLRLVKDRKDVRMHIALTRATDVVRIVGIGIET